MFRTHRTLVGFIALAFPLLSGGDATAQTAPQAKAPSPHVQALASSPTVNLQISSFTLTNDGGRWSLKVGVRNSGSSASTPCSLKMQRYTPVTILGHPAYFVTTVKKSLITVPAYTIDYVTVTFDLGTGTPAGWGAFTVDCDDQVSETNETDNTQNYYFP